MADFDLLSLTRDAVMMIVKVSGPALLLGLVVGTVIALVQAIVQVNEMTLTFVPKLAAILVSLILLGPWLGAELVGYGQVTIGRLAAYGQPSRDGRP
mgnify:FL=1|jgi:flagellar biosynthetic protein FliQ